MVDTVYVANLSDGGVWDMVVSGASVGATILALIAITFTVRGIYLQKKALQTSVFNTVVSRVNELENEWQNCKADSGKSEGCYERLFSAFEYFAFLANHKLLDGAMIDYYRGGIIECWSRLDEYPKLKNHYETSAEGQMSEFRKLYKKYTGSYPF
ncbi:MAG: hypothetical protein KAV42_01145 [Candidatus Krumholzibacteria bacterium]|nr:hypothetical protein [Candidatus Krumholzibacteria bacterium]